MLMFALLAASVICDVFGQVCFKLGVGHDHDAAPTLGIAAFALGTLRSPWVLLGLFIYVIEFAVWFAALSLAPLSLAFPFAALTYCGVVVASRFLLHERVSTRRWLGTVAVAAGVALVFWS
ncbi:MAG TPA: EamA family transporter [Rudaea sp.]|jgi:drug/metabolite transporter (DMT)-like permease